MVAVHTPGFHSLTDLLLEFNPRGVCTCHAGNGRNCHILILKGYDKLKKIDECEQKVLFQLPKNVPQSRLACRIAVEEKLNGLIIAIITDM